MAGSKREVWLVVTGYSGHCFWSCKSRSEWTWACVSSILFFVFFYRFTPIVIVKLLICLGVCVWCLTLKHLDNAIVWLFKFLRVIFITLGSVLLMTLIREVPFGGRFRSGALSGLGSFSATFRTLLLSRFVWWHTFVVLLSTDCRLSTLPLRRCCAITLDPFA